MHASNGILFNHEGPTRGETFVTRAGRLPLDLAARIEASVAEQLVFLERNLETDICGNHLIKNIKALIWASAYFTGPFAERWRRLGLKYLQRQLSHQIPGRWHALRAFAIISCTGFRRSSRMPSRFGGGSPWRPS